MLLESVIKAYESIFENVYDAYHGSKSVFEKFDPSFVSSGGGSDQYGFGFYFTNNPKVASTYASGDTANIKRCLITINKPIVVDEDNPEKSTTPPLNIYQLKKLFSLFDQTKLHDKLYNWYDMSRISTQVAIDKVSKLFTSYDNAFHQLIALQNDFFDDDLDMFGKIYPKASGYDGIIVKVTDDTTHYIVWDSEKIKNFYLTNKE